MAPLAGRLYVGTSGFAYPDWAPTFYPRRMAGRDMLTAYAARLMAVELNSTFYRRPGPSAIAGWLAATPDDFRFCPRAQRGTALRALRSGDPAAAVGWLAEAVAPFGARLGCVLLSVPPTIPRDDAALAALLSAWPTGMGLALDLAHPSWVDDSVHATLRRHAVALVATDADASPEPDLRRSGSRLYLRLRRASYLDADLARWSARLEPFLEAGLDVYAFFRHDADGTSALRAERLATILGQEGRAGYDGIDDRGARSRVPRLTASEDFSMPSKRSKSPAPTTDVVVTDLQATLVELIDLALASKQAHWNVVGPNFRSVHLELDEIVDTARLGSDRVAERIATVGAVPDGRSSAVAQASGLPAFPDGRIGTVEVVERIGSTIDTVTERMRGRIERSADPDPVSQDILIGVADALEKHAWMLRAQLA